MLNMRPVVSQCIDAIRFELRARNADEPAERTEHTTATTTACAKVLMNIL